MSSFEPRMLSCVDCGTDFEFTAEEQEFFAKKGFGEPKRCPTCRSKKKQMRTTSRQMTSVTCAKCGNQTEVPFVPRGDRDVFCNDCFRAMKGSTGGGMSRGGFGGGRAANDDAEGGVMDEAA